MLKTNYKYVTFIVFFLIFLYLFSVYNINFRGADQPVYFAYTASIIDDGDLNIVNQLGRTDGMDFWKYYVTETYNYPAIQTHGGVTLWIPFYASARFIYALAGYLHLKDFTKWEFIRIAKSVMSFSTIVFGLFILFFTYKLCRVFFSKNASIIALAAISFGTPFFYYVIHDLGQANIPGSILAIILIWAAFCMVNMKKLHWFLFGMFYSVSIAVRVEIWLQMVYLLPMFFILYKSKKVDMNKGVLFLTGFFPVFVLRAINAFIKYGCFHMEEILPISSSLSFHSPFNGLFAFYRSVFYTSPVLYICLLGVSLLIYDIFRQYKYEQKTNNYFLFLLAIYLLLKIFFVKNAFGFGSDFPGLRWLVMDFSIFVLLFAQALKSINKRYFTGIIVVSVFFIFWNYLILSECLTSLDWFYILEKPGIFKRLGQLKYVFSILFNVNNLGIKSAYSLPLALPLVGLLYYFSVKLRFPDSSSSWHVADIKNYQILKPFSFFTVYLVCMYTFVTGLNLNNNRRNVEKQKAENYFDDKQIVATSAIRVNEFEDNYHHTYALAELNRYYALKGDSNMFNRILEYREKNKTKISSQIYPDTEFSNDSRENIFADYRESGKPYKAIKCLNEIIRLHPKNMDGYLTLGDIYVWTGDYNKAIETYEDAVSVNPEFSNIYMKLSEVFSKVGNNEKAIEYLEKAIQLDSNNIGLFFTAKANMNLGELYKNIGEQEKAIGCLKKVLKFNPENVDANVLLAEIYKNATEYEKAVDYYKIALKFIPNSIDANMQLAEIYKYTGEPEKAIDCLKKVLKVNPKNEDANSQLKEIYENRHKETRNMK